MDFVPKMLLWDKGLGQAPSGSPWWRKGWAWCRPASSCLPACSVPAGQAGGMGSRAQGLAPGWVLHSEGCPRGKGWTPGCSLHRDVPPGAGFLCFSTASAEAGSGLYAATCAGRMGPWEIWEASGSGVGQSGVGRCERPSGGGCCASVRSDRREGTDLGCRGIEGGSHEGMRVPRLGRLATRPPWAPPNPAVTEGTR